MPFSGEWGWLEWSIIIGSAALLFVIAIVAWRVITSRRRHQQSISMQQYFQQPEVSKAQCMSSLLASVSDYNRHIGMAEDWCERGGLTSLYDKFTKSASHKNWKRQWTTPLLDSIQSPEELENVLDQLARTRRTSQTQQHQRIPRRTSQTQQHQRIPRPPSWYERQQQQSAPQAQHSQKIRQSSQSPLTVEWLGEDHHQMSSGSQPTTASPDAAPQQYALIPSVSQTDLTGDRPTAPPRPQAPPPSPPLRPHRPSPVLNQQSW